MLPVAIMEAPELIFAVTATEGLGIKVGPTTGKIEYTGPYEPVML